MPITVVSKQLYSSWILPFVICFKLVLVFLLIECNACESWADKVGKLSPICSLLKSAEQRQKLCSLAQLNMPSVL